MAAERLRDGLSDFAFGTLRRFQTSRTSSALDVESSRWSSPIFAEIDYSDAASCQNLDAVEPLLELAIAQAWNEFRDPQYCE